MVPEFADIRIVGLDEEQTARADPTQPLYDVHFVLSAEPPIEWCQIVQAHVQPPGLARRKAWPQSRYLVVRCAIDEVEAVLVALRPILDAANRKYVASCAAGERTRLAGEAFDVRERQKLREVKARLRFD